MAQVVVEKVLYGHETSFIMMDLDLSDEERSDEELCDELLDPIGGHDVQCGAPLPKQIRLVCPLRLEAWDVQFAGSVPPREGFALSRHFGSNRAMIKELKSSSSAEKSV